MKDIISVRDILLPRKDIDMTKWSVVACDQFTSQKGYWESLKNEIGDNPSTLNMIYPEVYLNDNREKRIERANRTMCKYLSGSIFETIKDSFILLSRDTAYVKNRLGLMLTVDLEEFDFAPFTKKPIRATEGTVMDRIPPRLEIRKNAPLELPHILLLMDDREKTVLEPLYAKRDSLKKLYDFNLNMGGGHITGWQVEDTEGVKAAIYALADSALQAEKYGKDAGFLFAVGDGNHSLVTAKRHWEAIREGLSEAERQAHPARYALVEVENLWGEALEFEPIHRVFFGKTDGFLDALKKACGGEGIVKVFGKGFEDEVPVSENSAQAILQIQQFIDSYLKLNPGFEVDYIHGTDHLRTVVDETSGIGLVMPALEKEELFPFVLGSGVLPKKAFSMGEAEEKRYYLEAKFIVDEF